MLDSLFILQALIVITAIVLFLAAALVIACWIAVLELRGAIERLRRGPEVPRDLNGRRLRERL